MNEPKGRVVKSRDGNKRGPGCPESCAQKYEELPKEKGTTGLPYVASGNRVLKGGRKQKMLILAWGIYLTGGN